MKDIDKNGIYRIKNKSNNKLYIGSTSNKLGFKERWKMHRRDLRGNKHCNDYLQKSWNKYGEDQFEFEILEICEKHECVDKEQNYINDLNPEYNICKVAGSSLGRKHSAETKIKISKNRDYGEPWNKGKKMPKEFGEKVSNSQKNSKACKLNIAKLNKSKRKPVIGTHIETGEIVELEYMKQDSRFHGSGIKACINGKIKSYKKYKWQFKNS